MEKKTILLIVFLFLNYADVVTTKIALDRGFIELNPFYLMNPTLHLIIKIVLLPLFLILIHRKFRIIGYYVLVSIYILIMGNNIAHLLFAVP